MTAWTDLWSAVLVVSVLWGEQALAWRAKWEAIDQEQSRRG